MISSVISDAGGASARVACGNMLRADISATPSVAKRKFLDRVSEGVLMIGFSEVLKGDSFRVNEILDQHGITVSTAGITETQTMRPDHFEGG
jgi:hypothetical protein